MRSGTGGSGGPRPGGKAAGQRVFVYNSVRCSGVDCRKTSRWTLMVWCYGMDGCVLVHDWCHYVHHDENETPSLLHCTYLLPASQTFVLFRVPGAGPRTLSHTHCYCCGVTVTTCTVETVPSFLLWHERYTTQRGFHCTSHTQTAESRRSTGFCFYRETKYEHRHTF